MVRGCDRSCRRPSWISMNGTERSIDAMVSDLQATFKHELRAQARLMVFAMVSVVMIMSVLTFALARFT